MVSLSTISAGILSICLLVVGALFNANVRRWAQEKGHDVYIVRLLGLIPRRWLLVCLTLICALLAWPLVWPLLPGATQDQNNTKLLPRTTHNEATAPPVSEATAAPGDSLISNTGIILNNKVDHNFIINGRPEQLEITSNSGKIINNTIDDNFVDGNVDLFANSGTVVNNEIERNTVIAHYNSNSNSNSNSDSDGKDNAFEFPFHVVDENPLTPDRGGKFTCSFRIQMDDQAKVGYLTVALQTNELLGFGVISSDPRPVWLNPFVGYRIAKVHHPGGMLTVWGRYSKAPCNHELRLSWEKNAYWQYALVIPKTKTTQPSSNASPSVPQQ